MANKIVTFSANDTLTDMQKRGLNPIYLDISMISKFNMLSVIPDQPVPEYYAYLGGENDEPEFILTEEDYNKQKILIQHNYNRQAAIDARNKINRAKKYKLDSLKDIEAVRNSLHNIFSWIPGERILNPEFGSNLRKLLYNGLTEFNKEQIAAEIRRSVTKWEPRVQIEKIVDLGTINDNENNTVHLEIVYTIPSLMENHQFVYDYQYTISN